MAEYIEREAAIESIMSEPPDAHYPHWHADKIKAIPAADVAPVRHGRWELVEYKCTPLDTDQTLVCTECGFAHQNDDWYNYCPNCGAKMDLEV